MTRVVLLGPPGVGKGTQAHGLSALLDVPVITTGDLFRAHVEARTDLGRAVAAVLAAGELVDDAIVDSLVEERLHADDAANGFILDGYPRTVQQAQRLDRILRKESKGLQYVIELTSPRDELVRRLTLRAHALGRVDDTPTVIARRLDVFDQQSTALRHFYERQGLLTRVSSQGAISVIGERLRAVVSASSS